MPGIREGIKGKWDDRKPQVNRSNIRHPKQWTGKGADSAATSRAHSHQSAPLSSLRDPASFAPPPKNIHYQPAAGSGQLAITAGRSSSSSTALVPHDPPPGRIDNRHYDTDSGGLGGGLSQRTLAVQSEQRRHEAEEAQRPRSPPKPFKIDSTGLSTAHLPAPPLRRGGGAEAASGPPPPPARLLPSASGVGRSSTSPAPPPRATALPAPPPRAAQPSPSSQAQPRPPPRLPARQPTDPNVHTSPRPAVTSPGSLRATPPTPPRDNAASRLANAGVRVPDLGVGSSGTSTSSSSGSGTGTGGGVASELSARFAGLSHRTSQAQQQGCTALPPPGQGGKADATAAAASPLSAKALGSSFSTLQRARQDPSSVSLAEARSAAATAGAVEGKYGAQIRSAGRWAGERYADQQQQQQQQQPPVSTAPDASAGLAAKKKPAPPPPPAKKAGLMGTAAAGQASSSGAGAPPVPMSSKPRPG